MSNYKTPRAFKQALTDRLKRRAKDRGMVFNRYRQLVLFERFMARVYEACGDAVILKGGYAMELRLRRARTTRDIDVRGIGDLDGLINQIVATANRVDAQFLSFELTDTKGLDQMAGEQVVYDGRRLWVQARLGGRDFGDKFGLDLSMADALVLPPDIVEGDDVFDFVGVEPLSHRVYPREAHVAEKLHAVSYKFPDGRINSRAKDLVDIGLLSSSLEFKAESLIQSVRATYEFRDTHPVPESVPVPPAGWDVLYEKFQKMDELPWKNVAALHASVSAFLNPLLEEVVEGLNWSPSTQQWH